MSQVEVIIIFMMRRQKLTDENILTLVPKFARKVFSYMTVP